MTDLIRLDVAPGQGPQRLDRFLAEALEDYSRAQLKKLIDDGRVRLDGIPVKAGTRLKGGETILLAPFKPEPINAIPQDIPLNILYEDSDLIVIDKPAGMVVHPAPGHPDGTLVNALLYHCRDLAGIGGELRPGIVHRLDKDTSGVLVATKNDLAHQSLAEQFKEHSIRRRYLALVHGQVQQARGVVDKAIGRHPTERKKMSSRSRQGRRAVTRWEVLRRFDLDRLSWLELALETGRTHQIRVHMSELNLPLVGDPVYGQQRRANAVADLELRKRLQRLQRQALHARLLGFRHPTSGEYQEFRSPLPEDLGQILDYLDEKYQLSESSRLVVGTPADAE
ncbi:RluA family pseudouridine synthase [Geothermobacter hydrogeniphilus]|uniref:Pseudouridine synthase n=1 Tax=Geothermobacter hydrogeniphilus TaxID=1969733 RepID=A0A1X0Y563_9BACT|nr:RluA family pseudouridine synthase [Geothermobacter hydrogeniphilus]ORJ60248.1 RNA pseudouridine synthase [Geothermobacter hydrogeniphilus]